MIDTSNTHKSKITREHINMCMFFGHGYFEKAREILNNNHDIFKIIDIAVLCENKKFTKAMNIINGLSDYDTEFPPLTLSPFKTVTNSSFRNS